MQGYSLHAVMRNQESNQALLGVQLGKACIEHGVSAIEVAKACGVSRECVYRWFFGISTPQDHNKEKIAALLASLTTQ